MKRILTVCAFAAFALSGCGGPQVPDVDTPDSGLSNEQLNTWTENEFIAAGISVENFNAQTYPTVACQALIGELSDKRSVAELVDEFSRIDGMTETQAQTIIAVSVRGHCPEQATHWDAYRKS